MTQRKLTKQEIGKLKQARNGIADGVIWVRTDEGFDYWNEVVRLLDAKIKHGTSDGKPWVEPEPPIPEGWRRADHPDDYMRDDVKFLSKLHREWKDRSKCSPGLRFFSGYTYIVPVDPPLTDQDACVWPRLRVMVRDHESKPWRGPYRYLGKYDDPAFPFVADSGKDGDLVWKQARRATPAEIEAANDHS